LFGHGGRPIPVAGVGPDWNLLSRPLPKWFMFFHIPPLPRPAGPLWLIKAERYQGSFVPRKVELFLQRRVRPG